VTDALDWETPPQYPSLAEVTTSSLPAYHHYVMAVEDYIISDDNSLPRAADHLRLATAADSTFARAHFLRAKVYDQALALDLPLEFAEHALILANFFSGRLPPWERQYAKGWQQWLVDGDLEGAVSTLKDLTETQKDYAWLEGVPLTLGRLLAHLGRWPDAVAQLKSYAHSEKTPTLRRALAWGQLAVAYQLTGDLDAAIEAIESELSMVSDRHGNRYWWIGEMAALALLYFEKGETEMSENLLLGAQEVASDDPRGLSMIGVTRFQMQQINRAETLAERILRIDRGNASGHYLRGLLSLKRKKYWPAVADLEAAASQEFDWDFLYHAAIAHAKRGDENSAGELLTLLIDILGGDAPGLVGPADRGTMGILLGRLGQHEEALTQGLAAVNEFPYPQAKYDLACIYAIAGDRLKAMEWLRAAFAEGYLSRRQARSDFNLENLWYDPDFILLTSGR
jgi:tetratricopeptide (TPR) repeat protein